MVVRFRPCQCLFAPEVPIRYFASMVSSVIALCGCRVLHARARHIRAPERDGSVTRPAAGKLQVWPVHIRCLRNVRQRRYVQLCSWRGRPAVTNHASYLISVTCCCCHLRLISPTKGWLHTRSNCRVLLLPCFQAVEPIVLAVNPSCLLVTFAQEKRCIVQIAGGGAPWHTESRLPDGALHSTPLL